MRITWVLESSYQLDPTVDLERIRSIGPLWGSWRTWRNSKTDNVICHDMAKCRELLDRAFQAVCNFYIPKKHYQSLQRPMGVKLYEGDYPEHLDGIEDIVAMHLASQQSDLVLLLGFDLSLPKNLSDRFDIHKIKNRHGLMRSVIQNSPQVQWVCVDDLADLDQAYKELPNLVQDSMANVFAML